METSSEQNNTASKKHRNRKHLGTSLALTGALTFGAGNATAQTTTTDTVPKSDTPERVLPTDTVTIQSSETKQKAESPNGAFLNLYQWIGTGTNKWPFSATRISGGGTLFKNGILQTKVFGFYDLDDNPLTSSGFWKLKLTKQVYKGLNIEGEYTFSAGNNSMKYGISYAGHAGNGGYKFTLLPVSHKGKNIDVIISASQKIGKNGSVNAFVDVDFLNKSFYGETEYVQSLGANLALFAQARYGGLIKEPFVQGVAWIRLNIH